MNDKTIRRPIRWSSQGDTDVGTVRKVNEDAIFSKPSAGLWAVADGMGGHEVGDVASSMIIAALDEADYKEGLTEIVNTIEDALLDVNNRMLEYADIMLDKKTMGSTVVSLIIRGGVGVCLWAGDSRLYRYRNSELLQLSRDHSQVEELLQQGFLNAEEAEYYPDSNVITRAVGVSKDLYIDVNVFSAHVGDTFLLCSDGLYNALGNGDILHCLTNNDSIEASAKNLISKSLDNGATDNVSVIIVKGELGAIATQKSSG